MSRYSGRESVLHAGTFAMPVLPLMAMSIIYRDTPYRASFIDIAVLWVVGLGISYGLIIIHEMGHVVAARLVGIEITSITIGHWRRLVSFPIGKTTVTLRAAPASGYVRPKLSPKNLSALRMIPLLLAGVAAECGVIGLIMWRPGPADILSFGDLVWAFSRITLLVFGGIHVLVNLSPSECWAGGEKHLTDGMQLLGLWRHRRERPARRESLAQMIKLDELCRARQFPAALALAETLLSQQPDNFDLRNFAGIMQMECGDLRQAEATWRDLLTRPNVSPQKFAEVLDSLSCLPLYHGRMDLLAEADAWTTEAMRYAPNAITLKGTRGSLLIELGRIDEGMAMLRDVIKRTECPLDQTLSSAYLAKGYSAKGDVKEAQRWMQKAHAIDANHAVVKRLNGELALVPATASVPSAQPSPTSV